MNVHLYFMWDDNSSVRYYQRSDDVIARSLELMILTGNKQSGTLLILTQNLVTKWQPVPYWSLTDDSVIRELQSWLTSTSSLFPKTEVRLPVKETSSLFVDLHSSAVFRTRRLLSNRCHQFTHLRATLSTTSSWIPQVPTLSIPWTTKTLYVLTTSRPRGRYWCLSRTSHHLIFILSRIFRILRWNQVLALLKTLVWNRQKICIKRTSNFFMMYVRDVLSHGSWRTLRRDLLQLSVPLKKKQMIMFAKSVSM